MRKRVFHILMLLLGLPALLLWTASAWVSRQSAAYVSADLGRLPEKKTALLLGTSPYLSDGRRNLYFDHRISAAAKLYRQGKVRHIIVSGDHSRRGYNEPDAMTEALVAQGVPAKHITADYAGLRTLDSVLRARDIFGQQSYIIVSQKFHNERAVYLAKAHGMDAYGYNAADVERYAGIKARLREYGARLKMFWDVWTGVKARHGGERIVLPD